MSTPLTEHFALEEFLTGTLEARHVPQDVRENLEQLALNVLEPVRQRFSAAVVIHSGWRPSTHNASVGGALHSDHTTGRAADFHVADTATAAWEENTIAAFHFIRTALDGAFGQVILEDHRKHYGLPGKLWVHVAIPSPKHPGISGDPNRVLVSHTPKHYSPFKESQA